MFYISRYLTDKYFDIVWGCHQWRIQKILVGGDLKHKTSKIRMSSPKLREIFRPKSEIQTFFSPKFRWSPKKKKKKKKVFTKIETDFLPDSLRLGRWGGMHPEMEPNYSKQRLIFRPKSLLLGWWGGMHLPPKSATGCHPPRGPPNGPPKNQFFERLNLGCQSVLISGDI